MKITEVRVFLTGPSRNYTLVKILTDDPEIYGVGDGTVNGSEPLVAAALEHFAPLLIGRDPAAIEDIWQTIYGATYWRGGVVYVAALAAIDLALWDIKGKVAGLPVYQLLGGASRDTVAVYGHAHGPTVEAAEASARNLMEQGYKYVRVQLDGGYGGYGGPGMVRHTDSTAEGHRGVDYFAPEPYLISTPRLFEHLRSKLGGEINLLHDVHEQLLPIEAARLAKDLEPYRLFYLEDALRPEHKEGFEVIRRYSTTALAIGEIFTSRGDCLPLFQRQLIDFIRIAPIHVGGITEAR
ncbi:MAG TPA: enolase C-terminal domain-like protein, partial [Chloroflexia bacterium]|nr:enolase C-terminal domain-like protein [Chloroflexia bacterium]